MDEPLRFVCDGSLGGLARWLRAAGYETAWAPGLARRAMLDAARDRSAVLLTTDHEVFLRNDVLTGARPALRVPGRVPVLEQLAFVLRALRLTRREPRCMSCGGTLERAPTSSVAERIPPRTASWKEEYFLCRDCGRLFWQGTHWERISAGLRAALAAAADREPEAG